MIITKLRIQEEHPMFAADGIESWPLPFCDLNLNYADGENGYVLKDSSGLGPPALIPVVEGFDASGTPMRTQVPEAREIALRIALNPQYSQTYSGLRDALYRYIGRSVFVKLMNGAIEVARATGYIQKVEPIHFSNRPDIAIVIRCDDAMFYAPAPVVLPADILAGVTNPVINYIEGTAPAGLELGFFNPGSLVANFSISNFNEFWFTGASSVNTLFQVTYPIDTGDYIIINTTPGSRSIRMFDTSTSTWINLAGYLNAGATWPMLYPGVNQMQWTLSYVTSFNPKRYTPRYWGV